MTPHGTYLGADVGADNSCESCHGSALGHIEEGDPAKIVNPGNHGQFDGSILCLSCHKSAKMDEWSFSAHSTGDVNCSDCHSVHMDYSAARNKGPELCYTCHSEVKASTYMPSHHPIAEGKLDCSDCHNPHGGPARLTANRTGRELCFSCHGEIEGPHVYEHAPVNEDCGICHQPHGSVANNLLKQNEPTLCLSCHPMHFHGTVVSVDGEFSVPQAPERASTSTSDGFKRGMLTKCTQCHTEVHGSDLPSQSISTGGTGLTR
jgi:DmsE family decaheme c-type cytochrome